MRSLLSVLAVLLALTQPAGAAVPACGGTLPATTPMVGAGALHFMFWHVYDAALYAPGGVYRADRPFALALTYHLSVEGRRIADTSIEEMRKNGLRDEVRLAQWHSRLRDVIPDVAPGHSLVGVSTGGTTVFCKDGQRIGVIKDAEFTRAFFDIWLSAHTSAPELRRQLLGDRR